jgi:hypothetical protein
VATRLRERIYTPLSASEARALVERANELIDELVGNPDEADDDGYTELEVFDDVTLSVEESVPEGAAKCRSAITLDYYGRVSDKAQFIALEKLIVAEVGDAVVWRGEGGEEPSKGAKLVALVAFVAEREKEVGGAKWRKIAELGAIEEIARKPVKTRDAKAGELEAASVHKKLSRMIEGNDPLAREALKKALGQTTPNVRAYAAALMENGATPDAEIAKELETSVNDVASSRDALAEILKSIR